MSNNKKKAIKTCLIILREVINRCYIVAFFENKSIQQQFGNASHNTSSSDNTIRLVCLLLRFPYIYDALTFITVMQVNKLLKELKQKENDSKPVVIFKKTMQHTIQASILALILFPLEFAKTKMAVTGEKHLTNVFREEKLGVYSGISGFIVREFFSKLTSLSLYSLYVEYVYEKPHRVVNLAVSVISSFVTFPLLSLTRRRMLHQQDTTSTLWNGVELEVFALPVVLGVFSEAFNYLIEKTQLR